MAKWCNDQRKLYKNNKLESDKVARLQLLGFEWDADDVDWNATFHRLLAYNDRYGDIQVPSKLAEDPPLANWDS